MPQFLPQIPPDCALDIFLDKVPSLHPAWEFIETENAFGRILAESVFSSTSMPPFTRSAMDGYAVRASDAFGVTESVPGYLHISGEILMGEEATLPINAGEAILIHTGGMLPSGANAVIPLEYTQKVGENEIEITRSVAVGENILHAGEDIQSGQEVFSSGHKIRSADIGGLMALGITRIRVAICSKVGIISTGNELIPPNHKLQPGFIRDINSYTLSSLVQSGGGESISYGIVKDDKEQLAQIVKKAHLECGLVIITAGSSASHRDITAEVIQSIGEPGIIVHGVAIKPGKPTILAVCNGKPVIGLPGNPVSAFVISRLFVIPVLKKLMGQEPSPDEAIIQARLSSNVSSQAGREDWIPVILKHHDLDLLAEPIISKSNHIFSLVRADGLICIPFDSTGLENGKDVLVHLL